MLPRERVVKLGDSPRVVLSAASAAFSRLAFRSSPLDDLVVLVSSGNGKALLSDRVTRGVTLFLTCSAALVVPCCPRPSASNLSRERRADAASEWNVDASRAWYRPPSITVVLVAGSLGASAAPGCRGDILSLVVLRRPRCSLAGGWWAVNALTDVLLSCGCSLTVWWLYALLATSRAAVPAAPDPTGLPCAVCVPVFEDPPPSPSCRAIE